MATSTKNSVGPSGMEVNDGFVDVVSKVSRKRKHREILAKMDEDSKNGSIQRPEFPPLKASKLKTGKYEMRKVSVPPHRYSPLKENWLKIYSTIVEYLSLQVRFNLKTRCVEIKNCQETKDIGALQKAADFVRAFTLGFDVDDALALVRLDDLFLDSFEVVDVKPLKGDHLSRAIGRIAGKGGKTKFTIENVTKTRIVLADSKVYSSESGSFCNDDYTNSKISNIKDAPAPKCKTGKYTFLVPIKMQK